MIVGDPEKIPFEFQYQLSINHAVGRIDFEEPEDYGCYAESVVRAEEDGVELPRTTALFSVENDDYPSGKLQAEHLVGSLSRRLTGNVPDWKIEVWEKDRAYKKNLCRLLGGDATPGVLLASCPGLRFPFAHRYQRDRQGGLICQDWPGPEECPKPETSHFFHAGDVPNDADPAGQIAFFFACYSAGVPREDNFPDLDPDAEVEGKVQARAIAPEPFVARLSQALLRRGALATVGHIDRGWTTSFSWQPYGHHIDSVSSLRESIRRLLYGHRLGDALRPLYRRYTAIAAQLAEPLGFARKGVKPSAELLSFLWLALTDARNFVILGDPAVRVLGNGGSSGRNFKPVYLPDKALEYIREQAEAQGVELEEWLQRAIEIAGTR